MSARCCTAPAATGHMPWCKGPVVHPAGPVDDLEFRDPDCPEGCGEVSNDGTSWWCPGCGATWEFDGTGGVREPIDVAS